VADGVHVHPLNTDVYVRGTVLPEIGAGAARAGRDVDELEVIVPTFAAPGDTADEVHQWREMARTQVAFYGSTPNYGFIFDQLGREGTTPRIRERQKAGDIAGMAAVIDDELLEHFCISGDWASVADGIVARYQGAATRVVSYFAGMAWTRDPASLGPWGELARAVRS
jgi:alkanesulfonate monooxygenase SsuD/methylene tetrahydromethanopterin reductase-like flavin-dependent oxidoreductase (luciferase family)